MTYGLNEFLENDSSEGRAEGAELMMPATQGKRLK